MMVAADGEQGKGGTHVAIDTLGAPNGGEKDGEGAGRCQADETADIGGDMGEQQRRVAGVDR